MVAVAAAALVVHEDQHPSQRHAASIHLTVADPMAETETVLLPELAGPQAPLPPGVDPRLPNGLALTAPPPPALAAPLPPSGAEVYGNTSSINLTRKLTQEEMLYSNTLKRKGLNFRWVLSVKTFSLNEMNEAPSIALIIWKVFSFCFKLRKWSCEVRFCF